ncbi:hypothetical protein H5410_035818 [Solanum commersonii]|uniref:Uncharacterized protein n=1 Tax=Solanum commersonii TaxID=4109 RepID=A0A9J5Y3P5_SOLCO|nr:hypothetical protein H5410_035818 [Solanum commersonii]
MVDHVFDGPHPEIQIYTESLVFSFRTNQIRDATKQSVQPTQTTKSSRWKINLEGISSACYQGKELTYMLATLNLALRTNYKHISLSFLGWLNAFKNEAYALGLQN